MIKTIYNGTDVRVSFELDSCNSKNSNCNACKGTAEYYTFSSFEVTLSSKHFDTDEAMENKVNEVISKCAEYNYYSRYEQNTDESIIISFEDPYGAWSFSCIENFEKALESAVREKIEELNKIVDIPYDLALIVTGVY